MIERTIDWSLKNRFLVLLFVGFAAFGGYLSLKNIPLDAIPDLSDVQVIVFTQWPGRSPDLVEDQVTYPIVSRMLAVPHVKVVRGYSMFGDSYVYILFEDGTDIYWARSRVLEYLSGLAGKLPEGVTPVLGPDATGVGWVYEYALVDRTGRYDLSELRTFQDWYLKFWLESVPGVAEVAPLGGFVKQYQVQLDPNKLLAYKLPLKHVVMSIQRSNQDVGGRVLEFAGKEFKVRGRGYIDEIEDLKNVVVGHDQRGTPILLKDVAVVTLGPDIRRGIAELNGEGEVVGGVVIMRYGENALNVIRRVKEKLKEVKKSLPEGMEIIPTYDRSELILHSIATLKEKLIEESIVVSLVAILFLYHFPSALVAILMLPVAILLSFILMAYFKTTANIMSLGGIAIAIGAMVDAAIVMIENAHRVKERAQEEGQNLDQLTLISQASKVVGKPLFFSLLIITVSFIPVFALEDQEGRLFKPLAYTKTLAMFFASLLSITLVPVLMLFFVRGKIRKEEENPINRLLLKLYHPIVKFALKYRYALLLAAMGALILTYPAYKKLGSEFMPPLNEGDILYMPSFLPGISITEAGRQLQLQDKILKTFPEVERVFGKIGRAVTATDPAPLEMVETTVRLKDKEHWRKGMTWGRLVEEMNSKMQFPGVTNVWTMPIKNRIDMLTTGIKTPVGIKIFGDELKVIEEIGKQLEAILPPIEGTRSVYAERVTGGYFLDFTINREASARYGLNAEDVEMLVSTAIGGMNIDWTVEGRERYPINVRYLRELRDNVDKLKRVLVPTPTGAQVPIAMLADIRLTTGPPMIKSEAGQKTGWVFVDIDESKKDIGSYVAEAKALVESKIKLPAGYVLQWSGQFESMQRVRKKLTLVVPLVLVIIFVLLFFNFQNVTEAMMVLLSVPFSLIGAFWILFLLGYNLSIAVWVGIIALAGVAAEMGVVMIIYLDEAYHKRKQAGEIQSLSDIFAAVEEGAALRVRPKVMTASAIMMGLLPIMWSSGSGADVMKRIAAPMIGGMTTATLLALLFLPAIYSIWRELQLKGAKRGG